MAHKPKILHSPEFTALLTFAVLPTVQCSSVVNGALAHDRTDHRVSSAGDVNGDGIDDFLIGARVLIQTADSLQAYLTSPKAVMGVILDAWRERATMMEGWSETEVEMEMEVSVLHHMCRAFSHASDPEVLRVLVRRARGLVQALTSSLAGDGDDGLWMTWLGVCVDQALNEAYAVRKRDGSGTVPLLKTFRRLGADPDECDVNNGSLPSTGCRAFCNDGAGVGGHGRVVVVGHVEGVGLCANECVGR